jgi:large subunit ribosomal protein L9
MTAEADRKDSALKQSEKMDGLSIAISASVSEEGTLYGSIGTREIADALNEKGFEVEKSAVRLPEGALKELGEYSLDIELHPEVIRSITIQITALEEN